MIYKDWSNEFGVRLQEITGIEASYFKEIYDYRNQVLPQYNKYIISDGSFILPIIEGVDRYTNTKLPYVFCDSDLNQVDLLFNQEPSMFEKYNLKILENARQDYVIPLKDSFESHKKELSRVSRYYNKCSKLFQVSLHRGMFLEEQHKNLCDNYAQYWVNKGDEPVYYCRLKSFLNQVNRLSECYTIEVIDEDTTIALAYFEIINNEVYWHATIRSLDCKYEKLAIGNFVLLEGLNRLSYCKNSAMNLGVSWYSYKEIWHPVKKNVRGLSYIKEVSND